ncbi:hypothetical protein MMC25_004019 [Agyrium rufum]|nr:hypothetical protein [Agyrium rufum]
MAFTSPLLPSSSRRDIVLIGSVICFLTLIITFRSAFTRDSLPWHTSKQPILGGNTESPAVDSDVPEGVVIHTTAKAAVPHATTIFSTVTVQVEPTSTPAAPARSGCEGFPNTDDILLVMKTGATEAYDKLPIHFVTTLLCNNDTIYFSDMEMDMGPNAHLIDTLSDVPDEITKGNGDFDLYRKMKEYHELNEDPRPLKEGMVGWNLDKYKFLHMLLKTWKYRQDAPWYVFIEADTALIWSNLRPFLDRLDSKKKHYIGSPTYLNIEFAHGGTGYIISNAAMKAAVGDHPEIAEKYDKDVKGICCGDFMIGRVLLDQEIKLTRAWPLLNGEKPNTFPYAQNHWCQPIMTMHHLSAQEVSLVWEFEQEKKRNGDNKPLIFMDIFNHFVLPHLRSTRKNWSNLAGDFVLRAPEDPSKEDDENNKFGGRKWSELSETMRSSPESPEKCAAACEEDRECMEWQHHDRECSLGRSVKFGGVKTQTDGKEWVSGWMMDRIGAMREKLGTCEKVDWMGFA